MLNSTITAAPCNVDQEYLGLVKRILEHGERRKCRNGRDISLFGEQIKIDCTHGFPILTTKKIFFRGIVEELLWMFILGRTDVKYLQDRNVHIWDGWVNKEGTIGPGGYHQITNWNLSKINQIKNAVKLLKADPYSRRNFVSAWNAEWVPMCTLPPCHISHQLNCGGDDMEFLDLHMYQRSADMMLGVPFNIGQYALLLFLYARQCDKIPRNLIISFGDVHIYEGHEEGAREQLSRKPFPLPQLCIDKFQSMFDIEAVQIRLKGYQSHPAIQFEVFP